MHCLAEWDPFNPNVVRSCVLSQLHLYYAPYRISLALIALLCNDVHVVYSARSFSGARISMCVYGEWNGRFMRAVNQY